MVLRGSFDLLTALERFLCEDCTDFRGAPSIGVPEGSVVLGDPADVIVMGAAVEPGVVFDVRQRRGRARSPAWRCATARGSRARSSSGADPRSSADSSARRRSDPSAGSTARSRRACSSATPTRAHDGFVGSQRRGTLGQPRRPDHDLQPQEHLRAGAARAGRGRRIETGRQNLGHALRRPRQDGDRHHAGDRHGDRHRGQRVRRADAAQVRPAVRVGRCRRRAAHGRRLPPGRRAGDAAARGRADAGTAAVARSGRSREAPAG